jgi:ABC-2 type transport system ATP-binding protein
MEQYYSGVYEDFDREEFYKYLENFNLDKNRKVSTFSKGMKKQLALLLGICAHTKYILCDETFDGLDPVARQAVKSLFAEDVADRGMTPVVASHNLRELEDICDHVGLLHRGGILLSKDLDDMKLGIHKVQCIFGETLTDGALTGLDVIKQEKRGSLYTLTVRGDGEDIMGQIQQKNPIFLEMLPLTLEEIFISETEVVGYDIKSLIL